MPTTFSRPQILLHWITVVLVAAQFVLHEPIAEAFDRMLDGETVARTATIAIHVFGGFLVFALTLARLGLKLSHGTPPAPPEEPALFARLSELAHWAFYALLVALPVTGAVAWFRVSETAGDIHEVLRALLLGLIAVHIAAALVHRFVWKTDVMQRMSLRGAK